MPSSCHGRNPRLMPSEVGGSWAGSVQGSCAVSCVPAEPLKHGWSHRGDFSLVTWTVCPTKLGPHERKCGWNLLRECASMLLRGCCAPQVGGAVQRGHMESLIPKKLIDGQR